MIDAIFSNSKRTDSFEDVYRVSLQMNILTDR